MNRLEFDKIANKVISKGTERLLNQFPDEAHVPMVQAIGVTYIECLNSMKDLLFEYHQELEKYLAQKGL